MMMVVVMVMMVVMILVMMIIELRPVSFYETLFRLDFIKASDGKSIDNIDTTLICCNLQSSLLSSDVLEIPNGIWFGVATIKSTAKSVSNIINYKE